MPQYDRRVGLHSSTAPRAFLGCRTVHEVSSSSRPWFDQCGAEQPLCCQTASSPVSFQVSGVDHDNVWFIGATRQAAKDAIKNALSRPTDKSIVKGLVRPINFRSVSPSQAISDDVDDSAYDTPIIGTLYLLRTFGGIAKTVDLATLRGVQVERSLFPRLSAVQ